MDEGGQCGRVDGRIVRYPTVITGTISNEQLSVLVLFEMAVTDRAHSGGFESLLLPFLCSTGRARR